MTDYQFKPIEREDLERVLAWRNRFSVRNAALNDHEITWEEHVAWFEKESLDATRQTYVYIEQGAPLGMMTYLEFEERDQHLKWSFYLTSDELPRGTGTRMCARFLEKVFAEMPIRKVYATVIMNNPKSLKLHKRLGFEQEGLLREYLLRGEERLDVKILSVTRERWREIWTKQGKDLCSGPTK